MRRSRPSGAFWDQWDQEESEGSYFNLSSFLFLLPFSALILQVIFSGRESDAPALSTPVQRNTRQREAILKVIQAAEGPLNVAAILERCRASVPRLGLAHRLPHD